MYQMVIQQYKEQEYQTQELLTELLVAPIPMKKIEFQGIPDSIMHISDLLIQNSLQQEQNYRLMDSLTPEDLSHIQAVSPRDSDRDNTPYRNISDPSSLKFSFEGSLRRELSHK